MQRLRADNAYIAQEAGDRVRRQGGTVMRVAPVEVGRRLGAAPACLLR